MDVVAMTCSPDGDKDIIFSSSIDHVTYIGSHESGQFGNADQVMIIAPVQRINSFSHLYFFDEHHSSKYQDIRDVWESAICSINNDHEHIRTYIYNLSNKLKATKTNNSDDTRPYREFLSKIYFACKKYASSGNDNKVNIYSNMSLPSFVQLVRFAPELKSSNKNSVVYIDAESGCFGLIIKKRMGKKNNLVLNLLMKENKEVIYSLVKKNAGVVKISGRAYFNENIEDSSEINNILVWTR